MPSKGTEIEQGKQIVNDSLGVRPLQALNRTILKGSVPPQSQSLVPEQNILRGKEPQGSSPAPGSAQASSGISYSRGWWGFGKPDSEMINKGFAGCEVWLSPCLGVLQSRAAMAKSVPH